MISGRPPVYLIDASSYVFRAFYGIRDLKTSTGHPTNATYGVTTMTQKFIKDYKPEWLAAVFDAGRKTFRNGIYEHYKANRPEAPDELVPQFSDIREVLEAMNVPVLEMEGYEADDLIATLAIEYSRQGNEVVIVTGDKDLMQLAGESVRLLDTMKVRWIGVQEVKERYGVEPDKWIEVIGLMGDAVDNIPGVKGIGEKSAIALIQRFQTIENLYDHLDELDDLKLRGTARIRKALAEGKEKALLSRELATVKKDVPIQVSIDQLRYQEPDKEKLRDLFIEFEFTHLLRELNGQAA
ncbi:MAG: 5'-3' exonuclease H3TH domain-containing protein [Candidatus Binatia bacterium]|jgi:DNA polymerase-1|nr:5'-3' exonuclease H3TH domain-containing protein [Candidatus Binatia bacterium]